MCAAGKAEELLQRVLDERRLTALVAAAGKGNWRAAAWLLERRYPERWGPVRRPETEPAPPELDAANDPFAEVDMLAERRRVRRDRSSLTDRGGRSGRSLVPAGGGPGARRRGMRSAAQGDAAI